MIVQMLIVYVFFCSSIPIAIATFPQTGTLDINKCEDHIKEWKDKDGNQVKKVKYNKGL